MYLFLINATFDSNHLDITELISLKFAHLSLNYLIYHVDFQTPYFILLPYRVQITIVFEHSNFKKERENNTKMNFKKSPCIYP